MNISKKIFNVVEMCDEKVKLDYNKLVETIKINTLEELYRVKWGYYPDCDKKFPENFRQKCIFRGVGRVEWDLIPKVLIK